MRHLGFLCSVLTMAAPLAAAEGDPGTGSSLLPWLIWAGVAIGIFLFILAVFKAFYRMVDQGQVLIVNKLGRSEPAVSFTGSLVIPVFHRAEIMDISVKTIEVDRRGNNGLICKDNIRADIKVAFFVRVNKTTDDVLRVATGVGVLRASDPKTLEELFNAKFSEALKTVGKRLDFVQLYNERDQFKEEILKVIGRDLNGYSLEDVAIDYLEQTPLNIMDPDNILDAEGRKKIIELTSVQRMKANEIEREAQKVIKKQDVEAREAILALERQQAEAEAKQLREIATNKAREMAEQIKVEAEEKKKAEEAKITTEQDLGVQRQNASREVQIAEKNREGAVMVENERINKERELEAIARERATELSKIEKEKAIAIEQKNIAEVVRERVAVEKTVTEEQQKIRDVEVLSEARRVKEAAVIKANQEAEQLAIKEVKQAEAAATSATLHAKEKLTLAEADVQAAEKEALAEQRRAEGRQATAAADGIAAARVKEMDAVASEKQGFAKARIMEAEAAANEKQGLAKARVLEAEAEAQKKQGLAKVAVDTAHADATERQGQADANARELMAFAEAKGIAEKAQSMAKLTEATRAHEEFRIEANNRLEVAKAGLDTQAKIAERSAYVMATALGKANIQIVGGDGQFFDKFVKAVSLGKSIDATVENSAVIKQVGKEYLEGDRSLPADAVKVLSSLGSQDLANLSLAAVLPKVFEGKDPAKIQALLNQAEKLGLVKKDA
jgi:uncharacterized membrane protein YqiK